MAPQQPECGRDLDWVCRFVEGRVLGFSKGLLDVHEILHQVETMVEIHLLVFARKSNQKPGLVAPSHPFSFLAFYYFVGMSIYPLKVKHYRGSKAAQQSFWWILIPT